MAAYMGPGEWKAWPQEIFETLSKQWPNIPLPTTAPLEITVNDRDFDTVARNIIIILAALLVKGVDEAVECMIHVWDSALKRECDLESSTRFVHQSKQYQQRRNILLCSLNLHRLDEIAKWAAPEHGMFLRVEVDWKEHPVLRAFDSGDDDLEPELQALELRVETKARANGVLVTRGSLCSWNRKMNDELRFRLTFVTADTKRFEEGARRFANALRAEFSLPLMESIE
ncbi:hypothetical protein BDV12DRAFT_198975 [Aspergillus spectabilis]